MSEESSGAAAKAKPDQVRKASSLLRRAAFSPKSARHVTNIAKAAAAGHPGAVLAQAAIKEARKQQAKPATAAAALAVGPPTRRFPMKSFTSWARGAA